MQSLFIFPSGEGHRQKSIRGPDKGQKELSGSHCAQVSEMAGHTQRLPTAVLPAWVCLPRSEAASPAQRTLVA